MFYGQKFSLASPYKNTDKECYTIYTIQIQGSLTHRYIARCAPCLVSLYRNLFFLSKLCLRIALKSRWKMPVRISPTNFDRECVHSKTYSQQECDFTKIKVALRGQMSNFGLFVVVNGPYLQRWDLLRQLFHCSLLAQCTVGEISRFWLGNPRSHAPFFSLEEKRKNWGKIIPSWVGRTGSFVVPQIKASLSTFLKKS